MKLYKIGISGSDLFLKAVILDTSGNKLELLAVPAFFEEEEAVYEEDKAKKYVELLNENDPDGTLFFMKEVSE